MHLASNAQGDGQTLSLWIWRNVENAIVTHAHGRSREDQTRGAHSAMVRSLTGPFHAKGSSRGYKPQEPEWRSEYRKGWNSGYAPHDMPSSSAALAPPAEPAAEKQCAYSKQELIAIVKGLEHFQKMYSDGEPFKQWEWDAWWALWHQASSFGH